MGILRKTPSADVRFCRRLRRAPNGCLLWDGAVGSHGYGNFWTGDRHVLAHRFAWEMANGPIDTIGRNGLVVLHDCPSGDNPLCCEPSHLMLGTHGDNVSDGIAKRRSPQNTPILTAAQVEDAHKRWTRGESQKSIAARFGVSQSCVGRTLQRHRLA